MSTITDNLPRKENGRHNIPRILKSFDLIDKFIELYCQEPRFIRSSGLLLEALFLGDEKTIDYVLEKDSFLARKEDSKGIYPIFHAIKLNNLKIIKKIYELFPEAIKESGPDRFSVLDWAICYGSVEVVKFFYELQPGLLYFSFQNDLPLSIVFRNLIEFQNKMFILGMYIKTGWEKIHEYTKLKLIAAHDSNIKDLVSLMHMKKAARVIENAYQKYKGDKDTAILVKNAYRKCILDPESNSRTMEALLEIVKVMNRISK